MHAVAPKTDSDRLKDSKARKVLLDFLQDISTKRREAKAAHISFSQELLPQDIQSPQVFFSYAWGEESDLQFQALQHFLRGLESDFNAAGVDAWFDLSRMIGHIDSEMRDGVNNSNLIILMGTQKYAEKTLQGSQTNVGKELEYSLRASTRIRQCSLVPWVLEGAFQDIFPSLGNQHLRQDASAWLCFDVTDGCPIRDMRAYIKALTSLENPVGLLAGALGLHRTQSYSDYRKALKASYKRSQALLTRELADIYRPTAESSILNAAVRIDYLDLSTNRDQALLEAPQSPSNILLFSNFSAPSPAAVNPAAITHFLKLVAEGKQEEAKALLQVTPALAQVSGTVTDLSGRNFEGITGFQYATWALDRHMWTMILNYLPGEQAGLQFQARGSWVDRHGVHAGVPGGSVDKLIQALSAYINHPTMETWQKDVGGAQLLLPAHVVHEYCRRDRSFYPCPAFLEPTLPPNSRG